VGNLLIRTEAGPELGMQRLQRALVLTRLMQARHDVTLILSSPPQLRRRLERLGIRTLPPSALDGALLEAQILVCDLSRCVPEEGWLVRASLVRRLSLVDMGLGAAGGEVAVDGSLMPYAAASPASLRRYGGPAYAVLAPRLRRLRSLPPPDPGPTIRLGVHLDMPCQALTARIRQAAALLEGRIQLSFAPRSYLNRRGLADWLAAHHMVITWAGQELSEAAVLGLPALVLWRNVFEAVTARGFRDHGYGWLLGDAAQLDPGALAKRIAALAGAESERLAMRHAARRLVDGRGAARVAALVENLMHDKMETPRLSGVMEKLACPAC
jgi:hypothetical protein